MQPWATWVLLGCGATLCASGGCNWRQPLPRGKDAGPPVEVVDSKPAPANSTGLPGRGGPIHPPTSTPAVGFIDEHEPNDSQQQAQPFELLATMGQPPGRGIHGSLAAPTTLGSGKGADDFYAVTVAAGSGPQLLRIDLSGSQQVNLSLDLLDPTIPLGSPPFAHVDERGLGEGERLSLALRPRQTLLVRVRGSVVGTPIGPASSAYDLVLTQQPAPPGSELEPNDTPEQASPALLADLSGTLPWKGDEDFWVLNLGEALYRRPPAATPVSAPAGIDSPAILRVELHTPGATPSLRLFIEPAITAASDGGSPFPGSSFGKLKFAGEWSAAKGSQELRLRNLPLPAGSARAFIAVRAMTPAIGKGPSEPRYQLRLTVEPPLEDAESEPNDDCAQAGPLAKAAPAGEESIAGFLWPGDVDCFRIRGGATRRHTVRLLLPGGSSCQATVDWVRSEGVEQLPSGDGGTATLLLRGRGDALLRVRSRDGHTCFDAPYRLVVRSETERP